jgi:hypothetical protein
MIVIEDRAQEHLDITDKRRTTRPDGKNKTAFPSRSRLAIKSTLDFIKSIKASLAASLNAFLYFCSDNQ